MVRTRICFPALCILLLIGSVSFAQHYGRGGRSSGGFGFGRARGFYPGSMGVYSPAPTYFLNMSPYVAGWPQPYLEPSAEDPENMQYAPTPGYGMPQPDRGPVAAEVKLDDCRENARSAGYSFSEQRVVSCEDSTVDVYLSYNEDGNYLFLVPEDTQIKDIGPRNEFRNIRLIKPTDWSPDHGAPLTAGHAYIIWTYSGDFFLVKVDALWEKHVMFSWVWHSRLSRQDAERFLKNNAGGPPGAASSAR